MESFRFFKVWNLLRKQASETKLNLEHCSNTMALPKKTLNFRVNRVLSLSSCQLARRPEGQKLEILDVKVRCPYYMNECLAKCGKNHHLDLSNEAGWVDDSISRALLMSCDL